MEMFSGWSLLLGQRVKWVKLCILRLASGRPHPTWVLSSWNRSYRSVEAPRHDLGDYLLKSIKFDVARHRCPRIGSCTGGSIAGMSEVQFSQQEHADAGRGQAVVVWL
jgi:hypothetical protein